MWICGLGPATECVMAEYGIENISGVFVEDAFHLNGLEICGLKVDRLSDVLNSLSKESVFVSAGYKNLNRNRAGILKRLGELGLTTTNIITKERSGIFPFAHGVNNFVMRGAAIQPFVSIKDNVFIWSGATICHHVNVASNVWITAGATVAGGTQIGENVFIGAGAIIGSGLVIGNSVFIGAGTLVTKDIPDNSVLIRKDTPLCPIDSEKFIKFVDLKGAY